MAGTNFISPAIGAGGALSSILQGEGDTARNAIDLTKNTATALDAYANYVVQQAYQQALASGASQTAAQQAAQNAASQYASWGNYLGKAASLAGLGYSIYDIFDEGPNQYNVAGAVGGALSLINPVVGAVFAGMPMAMHAIVGDPGPTVERYNVAPAAEVAFATPDKAIQDNLVFFSSPAKDPNWQNHTSKENPLYAFDLNTKQFYKIPGYTLQDFEAGQADISQRVAVDPFKEFSRSFPEDFAVTVFNPDDFIHKFVNHVFLKTDEGQKYLESLPKIGDAFAFDPTANVIYDKTRKSTLGYVAPDGKIYKYNRPELQRIKVGHKPNPDTLMKGFSNPIGYVEGDKFYRNDLVVQHGLGVDAVPFEELSYKEIKGTAGQLYDDWENPDRIVTDYVLTRTLSPDSGLKQIGSSPYAIDDSNNIYDWRGNKIGVLDESTGRMKPAGLLATASNPVDLGFFENGKFYVNAGGMADAKGNRLWNKGSAIYVPADYITYGDVPDVGPSLYYAGTWDVNKLQNIKPQYETRRLRRGRTITRDRSLYRYDEPDVNNVSGYEFGSTESEKEDLYQPESVLGSILTSQDVVQNDITSSFENLFMDRENDAEKNFSTEVESNVNAFEDILTASDAEASLNDQESEDIVNPFKSIIPERFLSGTENLFKPKVTSSLKQIIMPGIGRRRFGYE